MRTKLCLLALFLLTGCNMLSGLGGVHDDWAALDSTCHNGNCMASDF